MTVPGFSRDGLVDGGDHPGGRRFQKTARLFVGHQQTLDLGLQVGIVCTLLAEEGIAFRGRLKLQGAIKDRFHFVFPLIHGVWSVWS